MKNQKTIGAIMMLPLPIILISLVLKTDFWVYMILVAVASLAFSFGLKLLKGSNPEDLKDKLLDKIDNIKDKVEDRVEDIK